MARRTLGNYFFNSITIASAPSGSTWECVTGGAIINLTRLQIRFDNLSVSANDMSV